MKNYGIILASGSGSRFGADLPKQFVKIKDKTILEHTIEVFEKSNDINEIVVVVTPGFEESVKQIVLKNQYKKITTILPGGLTRKDSSYIGVSSIKDDEANVLIHDCARPFLSQEIIKNCICALKDNRAVLVAMPAVDTIVKVHDGKVQSVLNRDELMCAQTPQCFKLSLIKKAHEVAKNDSCFTDDCGLVVKYNLADVQIVEGCRQNIKITYKTDIDSAEIFLKNNVE